MVVPFAAGGGTDLVGRIVAQELSKGLNQQFYIENKAGAAGQVGTDLVAKSPARRLHAALDRDRRPVGPAGREGLAPV